MPAGTGGRGPKRLGANGSWDTATVKAVGDSLRPELLSWRGDSRLFLSGAGAAAQNESPARDGDLSK
jgi:hypothetical protein